MRTRPTPITLLSAAAPSDRASEPTVAAPSHPLSPEASVWLVFDAGGELFKYQCERGSSSLHCSDELVGVAA